MRGLGVEDVSRAFGATMVLAGATLLLRPGQMTALTGENGSGKSTLIAIFSGHLKADDGNVLLDGKPIDTACPRERATMGISRMFQESRLWAELSVAEHLSLVLHTRRVTQVPMSALLQASGVAPAILGLVPEKLSLLQRRRLELCLALHGTRYLLCDELGAGLSLAEARCLYNIVARAIEDRWLESALMVEHRQVLLDQYCSESAQLQLGKVRQTV